MAARTSLIAAPLALTFCVPEYVAIPLNDAARQHVESWTPTMHSLLEWQGRPHPVTHATSLCEPIAELLSRVPAARSAFRHLAPVEVPELEFDVLREPFFA